MRNVDFKTLVTKLRATEDQPTFTPPSISPYVRQHIYEPLLRGEQVLFAELDFTAFNSYDINELEDYIGSIMENTTHLKNLNKIFCCVGPVSMTQRAFC